MIESHQDIKMTETGIEIEKVEEIIVIKMQSMMIEEIEEIEAGPEIRSEEIIRSVI